MPVVNSFAQTALSLESYFLVVCSHKWRQILVKTPIVSDSSGHFHHKYMQSIGEDQDQSIIGDL